eukprot:gene3051-biopygen20793
MPIEDVDYLVQNSVSDSLTLFIDSSKRNRLYNRTPSDYVVKFEEPVKYVFGLDILDAAIPSTMYNVDSHNNELRLVTVDVLQGSLKKHDDVRKELETLSQHPLFDKAVQDEYPSHYLATVDVNNLSAHPVLQHKVDEQQGVAADYTAQVAPTHAVFVRYSFSGVPFRPSRETVNNTNVFNVANVGGAVTDDVVELVNPSGSPANRELAEWLATHSTSLNFSIIPSSTIWMQSVFSGVGPDTPLYDIVYYVCLHVTSSEFDSIISNGAARMSCGVHFFNMIVGNYTISSLITYMQELLAPISIDVVASNRASADRQNKIIFKASTNIIFVTCTNYDPSTEAFISSAASLLGFDDTRPVPCIHECTFQPIFLGSGLSGGLPCCMSILTLDNDTQAYMNTLGPPGIVNLAGPRFITLRCPEIEEHMCSSGRSSRYSTGLGVFKLASGSELSHLRFDFVSLVRKPFHPIGKLSRLSFRFELFDGVLYDFKGVNHQILINIKYYVPSKRDTGVRNEAELDNGDDDDGDNEDDDDDDDDENEDDEDDDDGGGDSRADMLVFQENNNHESPSLRITLCDGAIDGRECFLTCLDVLLKGLLRVFGGGASAVNISDIEDAEFERCITNRMRAMLDVYPEIESCCVTSSLLPTQSIYVAPLDSIKDTNVLRVGGDMEDYGVTFCIRGIWLMLRFKSC